MTQVNPFGSRPAIPIPSPERPSATVASHDSVGGPGRLEPSDHVVDPHHGDSGGDGEGGGGMGGGVTPRRRGGVSGGGEDSPRNPLREAPTSSGNPCDANRPSPASRSRLSANRLPKPRPGSRQIRRRLDAGGDGGCRPVEQEPLDLGDDVFVAGVPLHRLRRALHVHQDDHTGAAVGAHLGHLRPDPGR